MRHRLTQEMRKILLFCRVQIIAHCVVALQTGLGSCENILVNLAEPAYVLFSHSRWCDDSEESDWPTAAMHSKLFRSVNEWEWRKASHVVQTRFGARMLRSLVCHQLILGRIYSVQ